MNYQVLLTETFAATPIPLQIFFFTLIVLPSLEPLAAPGRVSKPKIANLPVRFYILIMRGAPLMLQLLFTFYALKSLLGTQLDRVLAAEVTLAPNYAAYFAEIRHGGLEPVPNGQREIAKVLGYAKSQVFFHIVLPQVIKRITPSMGNEFITLVKDISPAQVIGVVELLKVTSQWVSSAMDMTPLATAGPFYLVMNGIVTRAFIVLENRLSYYQ